MNFIIHAAGSLGNRADPGKQGYRLRFLITGHPRMTVEQLRRGLNACLDDLEAQMALQGFRFAGEQTIAFVGKRPHLEPMTIRRVRRPSAREMLPQVMQGARFRAPEQDTLAQAAPLLQEANLWDYIFSGLFVRDAILVEVPDRDEELRPS